MERQVTNKKKRAVTACDDGARAYKEAEALPVPFSPPPTHILPTGESLLRPCGRRPNTASFWGRDCFSGPSKIFRSKTKSCCTPRGAKRAKSARGTVAGQPGPRLGPVGARLRQLRGVGAKATVSEDNSPLGIPRSYVPKSRPRDTGWGSLNHLYLEQATKTTRFFLL